VDECRAHDPFILQVIDKLGYKKIIADFGQPKAGSGLAAVTSPPPPSRVNISEAKVYWLDFWTAKVSLMELFDQLNTRSIAMVLPERHQGNLKLLGFWLQRNVVEMVTQTYFNNWQDTDWSLGLLFNIHRLPMDLDFKEQIFEGMNMVEQPFMQAHMWPLVYSVTMLAPPKVAQFGVGDYMVQRSSYWGLLEIKGDNHDLMTMVSNMHRGRPSMQLPRKTS
jgi:hypothetical protein